MLLKKNIWSDDRLIEISFKNKNNLMYGSYIKFDKKFSRIINMSYFRGLFGEKGLKISSTYNFFSKKYNDSYKENKYDGLKIYRDKFFAYYLNRSEDWYIFSPINKIK